MMGMALSHCFNKEMHIISCLLLPNRTFSARCSSNPRMHGGRHDVELGRLAAQQPAASHGLLVQGEQAARIAQIGA
jgi:hypothetical protein